jgi:hypothetical protein
MLIKPFTASINSNGQGYLEVMHSLHGLVWKIYQLGIALGQAAPSPQVAAHVNGIPLAATVVMQPSVFADFPTQAPYAMESFMVGPPYINLSAGDAITVAVLGATPGDVLTVGAYIDENSAGMPQSMGS